MKDFAFVFLSFFLSFFFFSFEQIKRFKESNDGHVFRGFVVPTRGTLFEEEW